MITTSSRRNSPVNQLGVNTETNEDENITFPLSRIWQEMKNSMQAKDHSAPNESYQSIFNAFYQKNVMVLLSPVDQTKLKFFLSVYASTPTNTAEQKRGAKAYVSKLHENAKRLEVSPGVLTASGRVSPRSKKYMDYQKELASHGPNAFKEPPKQSPKKRKLIQDRKSLNNQVGEDSRSTPTEQLLQDADNPPDSIIKQAIDANTSEEARFKALNELDVPSFRFDDI